jgi:hypothetical protein
MTRSVHHTNEPMVISCQYLGVLQSGSLYPPSAEKLSKTSTAEGIEQDVSGGMEM